MQRLEYAMEPNIRKISVELSCFGPHIEMLIPIPNDSNAEEYIDTLLDHILAEDFRYNAEWEFE